MHLDHEAGWNRIRGAKFIDDDDDDGITIRLSILVHRFPAYEAPILPNHDTITVHANML